MKELLLALLIVLAIAIFIFAPIALVWALNTLFPVLNIPFTFSTWAAALVLIFVTGGNAAIKSNK